MKDLYSRLAVRRAVSPVSDGDNTVLVGQWIDTQGFNALLFAILAGSLIDADATFTVLVQDADRDDKADVADVADGFLNGTELAASLTFADDDVVKKIGYAGNKRFVRLSITPANNSSAALLAAVAILGNPALAPVA